MASNSVHNHDNDDEENVCSSPVSAFGGSTEHFAVMLGTHKQTCTHIRMVTHAWSNMHATLSVIRNGNKNDCGKTGG